MTRMRRAALGVCILGMLWASPLTPEAARAAPALKDRKGLTKEARAALRKRAAALREQLAGGFERVKIGKEPVADFLQLVRDWYESEITLADTREAERTVLENVVRTLLVGEEQMTQLRQAGLQPGDSVVQWQAARLRAQVELDKRAGPK
jgi:hypothetical protein